MKEVRLALLIGSLSGLLGCVGVNSLVYMHPPSFCGLSSNPYFEQFGSPLPDVFWTSVFAGWIALMIGLWYFRYEYVCHRMSQDLAARYGTTITKEAFAVYSTGGGMILCVFQLMVAAEALSVWSRC